MRLKVRAQVAGKREPLCADEACVGAVAGVEESVVAQVGQLAEAAAARRAPEGPRAAVHVLVAAQIARRRKRLETQPALVWFFLGVRHSKNLSILGLGA